VNPEALTGDTYLRSYLKPLSPHLERPEVTDVYVNAPQEIWVETLGGSLERHEVAELTREFLERLARQIAAHSSQGISREHPILSAALPSGERVQIIIAPATRGEAAIAIRKHVSPELRLDDYAAADAFRCDESQARANLDQRLQSLAGARDYVSLLSEAVRGRRNILISGGTSSGKTTFLNALIREIPESERLIYIEDTPELALRHPNAIGLLAARSPLGEASASAEDLLNASLRMRPDRIILGELRGHEAYSFLRAVNTGHPGSMTTLHADSPERAVEQIALLVLQGGTRLGRDDVIHYVQSTIDVFVQLSRSGGRRTVSEVQLRSSASRPVKPG
jgi:type IV secretion system protein VirB11